MKKETREKRLKIISKILEKHKGEKHLVFTWLNLINDNIKNSNLRIRNTNQLSKILNGLHKTSLVIEKMSRTINFDGRTRSDIFYLVRSIGDTNDRLDRQKTIQV